MSGIALMTLLDFSRIVIIFTVPPGMELIAGTSQTIKKRSELLR